MLGVIQGAGRALTQRAGVYPLWVTAILVLSSIFLIASVPARAPDFRSEIRDRVQDEGVTAYTAATIQDRARLLSFYEKRGYEPVWIKNHAPKLDARFLLEILSSADHHGFDPQYYYLHQIRSRMDSPNTPTLAQLDIILTMAYTRYVTWLRHGRLLSTPFEELNSLRHRVIDPFAVLDEALETDTLFSSLYRQEPTHPQYTALRKQLKTLRNIAASGGWPILPTTHLLKPGFNDSRISMLKKRLKFTGDVAADDPESKVYDQALKQAVKNFQARNGLLADGVAGQGTLDVLNIPVEARIKQVIINMERWRALPPDLGPDHILVNTAGFRLYGVRNGQRALEMDVVVGREDWSTPALTSELRAIQVNPEWRVPRSIATQELLPLAQSDPQYLSRNGYEAIRWRGGKPVTVDPSTINWNRFSESYLPYDLRKIPGKSNPLGKIKFLFPNEHDVYLHDTPHQQAFRFADRSRSHGCIRLSRPQDLFDFVLAEDIAWDRATRRSAWRSSETVDIQLGQRLPVHLAYLTAWVEDDGRIGFYQDVYNQDTALIAALDL